MPAPKDADTPWIDIRSPGTGGWNVFDDSSTIGDIDLAEAQNIALDGGFLAPRSGSELFASKPSGESNSPLQMMIARTSDGITYKIAVYGNKFYLYHPDNEEFIQLNPLFEPDELTRLYGWENWNNGRGDDRFYACNGVDDFVRWDLCVSRLDGNQDSTVSTIKISDATRFPTPSSVTISSVDTSTNRITATTHGFQTGDIVFYDTDATNIGGLSDGGIYFVNKVDANTVKLATTYDNAVDGTTIDLTSVGSGTQKLFSSISILLIKEGSTTLRKGYTAKSGNDLTIAGTLGTTVGNLSSVATMMRPRPAMEIGKMVAKHQKRLFVANYKGGENTIWYSKQDDPENFTTGAAIADASTAVIADGYGEITGLHDFGVFLVIEKENSFHAFSIQLASDLGSKIDKIEPLMSGQSVGPLGQHSTVKVFNALLYPTRSEGFIAANPTGTGNQTSIKLEPVSQKIQPFATGSISTTDCRGTSFDRTVLWAVGTEGATENSFVLMYDLERSAWTKITGWAVKDWGYDNGELFYLERTTGNIMQCFTAGFNDDDDPYEVRAVTKRFDFGKLSKPKTSSYVYLQGYMTPATDLYVDIFFNESGILNKQTYLLNKDTDNLYLSQPLTNALGEPIMGLVALGYVSLIEVGNLSFFRAYLGMSNRHGYYNLQLQFRQNKQAFFAITGIGFDPTEELVVPSLMVVSPVVET